MSYKKHKLDDPFPDDFWNYTLNPITGWKEPFRPTGNRARAPQDDSEYTIN